MKSLNYILLKSSKLIYYYLFFDTIINHIIYESIVFKGYILYCLNYKTLN